jgi:hypothetical protein
MKNSFFYLTKYIFDIIATKNLILIFSFFFKLKMTEHLQKLIKILETYTNFLSSFKVLLNTHNLQFLVENHWSNEDILRSDLRDDLDRFLRASKNNHTPNLVKYFHFLDENNAKEEQLSLESLNFLFLEIKKLNNLWNEQVITQPERVFALENQNKLELIEFENFFEKQFAIVEKQNRFMNKKKSYEVDIMSKFVAKLTKMVGLSTVSTKIMMY